MNLKNATPKELIPIICIICEQFLITFDELINEENKKENIDIKEARAIVCYYIHKKNFYSASSLCRILNTSPSNVANVAKRVEEDISFDQGYNDKIERIINLLN